MRSVSNPVGTIRRGLTTVGLALGAVLLTAVPAAAAVGPVPTSMASLGDSITRGFNACGFYVDCPSRSFATGGFAPVDSQATRIQARAAAIAGHAFNDAKSGGKIADMPGQAATAVSQHVQYVTMLIGGNDACTPSESTMTSVVAFRASLDATLRTLKSGLPGARVELVSIPDVKRLWAAGWLVRPPGFDPAKRYPVVFLIHGGPQGAWHDEWHGRWNYAMFAAPGYASASLTSTPSSPTPAPRTARTARTTTAPCSTTRSPCRRSPPGTTSTPTRPDSRSSPSSPTSTVSTGDRPAAAVVVPGW